MGGGKTQVRNAVDDRPEFCDTLEQIAQRSDLHASGIKVFGTPLGHPQFVEAHLNKKIAVKEVLLERILAVPDLQSSRSLFDCASARAKLKLLVDCGETRSHEGIFTAT